MKDIKTARDKMNDKLKAARKDTKAFKQVFENEKAKRSWQSHIIQNKKELLLKHIGADRGAAHGGDLQERGCTNLIQNADYFLQNA